MFVGIDGYSRGWVAVAIDDRGFVRASCDRRFSDLMQQCQKPEVICVDTPIGLVEGPVRDADQATRRFLTGAASTVFNAPVRSVLAARDYADANATSLRVCGKGLSRQTYGILDKIREVDEYVGDERLFEVHPEVSFRLMNDQKPLGRKKTWGGLHERLALLAREEIVLPASLGDVDAVGVDDVVDAAAAAWSARRIARDLAVSFPDDPVQRDASGRQIAIWG